MSLISLSRGFIRLWQIARICILWQPFIAQKVFLYSFSSKYRRVFPWLQQVGRLVGYRKANLRNRIKCGLCTTWLDNQSACWCSVCWPQSTPTVVAFSLWDLAWIATCQIFLNQEIYSKFAIQQVWLCSGPRQCGCDDNLLLADVATVHKPFHNASC